MTGMQVKLKLTEKLHTLPRADLVKVAESYNVIIVGKPNKDELIELIKAKL